MISGAAVSKENDAIKAVLHANRSMAHINMVNWHNFLSCVAHPVNVYYNLRPITLTLWPMERRRSR